MSEKFSNQVEEYYSIWKKKTSLSKEMAKESGLSETGYLVFFSIYKEEKFIQKDICEMWSLRKQTVNTILKELEKKEFISLSISPSDRRNKFIELTEKGKQEVGTLIDSMMEMENRAWKKMSPEEREALLSCSRKYLSCYEEEYNKFFASKNRDRDNK